MSFKSAIRPQPLEKIPKINKRSATFIPDSRVCEMNFSNYLIESLNHGHGHLAISKNPPKQIPDILENLAEQLNKYETAPYLFSCTYAAKIKIMQHSQYTFCCQVLCGFEKFLFSLQLVKIKSIHFQKFCGRIVCIFQTKFNEALLTTKKRAIREKPSSKKGSSIEIT